MIPLYTTCEFVSTPACYSNFVSTYASFAQLDLDGIRFSCYGVSQSHIDKGYDEREYLFSNAQREDVERSSAYGVNLRGENSEAVSELWTEKRNTQYFLKETRSAFLWRLQRNSGRYFGSDI